jgi:hypothetical protein
MARVLFVERRDGPNVPIDAGNFPACGTGYAHTEYREQDDPAHAPLRNALFGFSAEKAGLL